MNEKDKSWKDWSDKWNEQKKELKSKSTEQIKREYPKLNSDFRRYAREELKRRKVKKKNLPYKVPKKRKSSSILGDFRLGDW